MTLFDYMNAHPFLSALYIWWLSWVPLLGIFIYGYVVYEQEDKDGDSEKTESDR